MLQCSPRKWIHKQRCQGTRAEGATAEAEPVQGSAPLGKPQAARLSVQVSLSQEGRRRSSIRFASTTHTPPQGGEGPTSLSCSTARAARRPARVDQVRRCLCKSSGCQRSALAAACRQALAASALQARVLPCIAVPCVQSAGRARATLAVHAPPESHTKRGRPLPAKRGAAGHGFRSSFPEKAVGARGWKEGRGRGPGRGRAGAQAARVNVRASAPLSRRAVYRGGGL